MSAEQIEGLARVIHELHGISFRTAHAAVAALAPVLELRRTSECAAVRLAHARSNELALRAVALAEETLPRDSLVTVHVRWEAVSRIELQSLPANILAVPDAGERMTAAVYGSWSDDARLVALSKQNLAALHLRWRAGALDAPNADEYAFFRFPPAVDARRAGARLCALTAWEAVDRWPLPALDDAALRDLRGVLCAVLEAEARGALCDALPPGGTSLEDPSFVVWQLCRTLLRAGTSLNLERVAQRAHRLQDLRLTHAQTAALRTLHQRMQQGLHPNAEGFRLIHARATEACANRAALAAAELERHGLRSCALPACGAEEPAPRTFKKCGRCGAAHYCCPAHAAADWKRHKREDACKAPAAAP
jgi:hypothetical protein